MRRPVIFVFAHKVQALEAIKQSGLGEATRMFCPILGYRPLPMREALEALNRTNVLLDEGIVEKSNGLITFTYKRFCKQPSLVTPAFLKSISTSLAERITQAIEHLNIPYAPPVIRP